MIKTIQSRLHISIYKFYLLERKRNLAKTDFFFQIHVYKNLILDIYSLSKTRLRLYFQDDKILSDDLDDDVIYDIL